MRLLGGWYAPTAMRASSSSTSPKASPRALFLTFSAWFGGHAYVLLVFTMLIWGANSVAARLAVGEIPPMLLTSLRWAICCIALFATSRREITAHWRTLIPHWRYLLLMGSLGFTGFNALFYAAAHHTTAINLAIIQGTIPVFVLIGGLVFLGTRVRSMQVVGVLLTLAGIAVVASQGQVALLRSLAFNIGDVWMVIACVLYAIYALGLRRRPAVPPIVFFTAVALVAALVSLPLAGAEIALGQSFMPTGKGWLLLLFTGLLPSFISQVTFIKAVGLIGPVRAGVFMNLVPVFGPLLAVAVLGESISIYHGVALALVLGGIAIAEHPGKPSLPN